MVRWYTLALTHARTHALARTHTRTPRRTRDGATCIAYTHTTSTLGERGEGERRPPRCPGQGSVRPHNQRGLQGSVQGSVRATKSARAGPVRPGRRPGRQGRRTSTAWSSARGPQAPLHTPWLPSPTHARSSHALGLVCRDALRGVKRPRYIAPRLTHALGPLCRGAASRGAKRPSYTAPARRLAWGMECGTDRTGKERDG